MAKKHKLQVKTHYSSLYTQFNHYYLVMSLQSTFWLYLLYKNIRAQYIKQTQISKSNQGFREHHKTQKVSKCSTNLNRRFDQGRLAPLSLWVIARWRVRKAPRHRNQKNFVRVYVYICISIYVAQICAKNSSDWKARLVLRSRRKLVRDLKKIRARVSGEETTT